MSRSPPLLVPTSTDIIGASFATIEIDNNDEFVISSCNKLFIDMIGRQQLFTFPVSINQAFSDIDADEFLYYLHMSNQNKCALEFELSLINNDTKHWWLLIITPMLDQDEAGGRLLITGINISEKKQLQNELDISRIRYRSVIQSVHDCIITTDEKSKIILFNKAAEQTWGYNFHEVAGKDITMLLPTKFRANHQRYVDDFSSSITQSRKMSSRSIVYGQRKDNTMFPAEISISKMKVNSKLEYTAIVRDISEQSRLLEELQLQAMTDGLTGLKNRIFLDKVLKREIEQIEHSRSDLSLLLIDIDHFKTVNDSYGHAVGDQVLVGFAKIITNILDEGFTFARYGGEEFVILLPGVNQQLAHEIANNICDISRAEVHINKITCTVSVGVSVFNPGGDSADTLLHRADIALYKAKAAGRDCVELSNHDDHIKSSVVV